MGRSKTKSEEKIALVKSSFDEALRTFHHQDFLPTDPLQIPHRYSSFEDRELTAFVAALFSFGNVKSILKTLNALLEPLGSSPVKTLTSWTPKQIKDFSKNRYYRFFSSSDIESLFLQLRRIYKNSSQGLQSAIPQKGPHLDRIFRFRENLLKGLTPSPGLKFMFPDPSQGAAKRLHMFLRWVVRRDDVDLGIWKSFRPSDLIVPLDTHVFQICRGVGLTPRNQPGLMAAVEITNVFKTWDAHDPLKYDFAICRLGILKQKTEFLTNFKTLARGL